VDERPRPEGPTAADRTLDLAVAEVALRNGRVCAADLEPLYDRQAALRAEGKWQGLGQLLIRSRKIAADDYLEITRKAEEPLFRCPDCGERLAARDLHGEGGDGEPGCRHCGARVDPERQLRALPDEALRLTPASGDELPVGESSAAPAGGPVTEKPPPEVVTALDVEAVAPRPPPPPPKDRSSAAVSARSLLAGGPAPKGRIFGRYELLETVGQGGMGVVYRARQIDLDRVVALKVLREGEGATEEQVRRFHREAESAARLQHPSIVAIHEVGVEEGVHFFSMDYIEGYTLHQRLAGGERLPFEEGARLVAELARALDYAHRKGVVHRDLKPGNVIIDGEGAAHITDFGLAKVVGQEALLTASGVAIGTPLYMSPEQARGDLRAIDGRSDIFSLGTILYQLLTNELPFTAQSHVGIYNRIIYDEPVPPRRLEPAISRDLETICLKALEKRPERRYASGVDLAQDLERAAAGEPILARRAGPLERLGRAARRQRVVVASLASALAVLVAALAVSWWTGRRAEQDEIRRAEEARRAEAAALLAEVEAAAAGGRPAEVVDRADRLLARFPTSAGAARARLLAGDALLALGRVPEAVTAFARAYRQAADEAARARALVSLGEAFARQGERDRALACHARTLARFAGRDEARRADLGAGLIFAETDDLEAARRHLERAATALALRAAEREAAAAALAWVDRLSPAVDVEEAASRLAAAGASPVDGRPAIACARGSRVAVLVFAAGAGDGGGGAAGEGATGALRIAVAADDAIPRGHVATDLVVADIDGDERSDIAVAVAGPGRSAELRVLSARGGRLETVAVEPLAAPVPHGGLAALRRPRPGLLVACGPPGEAFVLRARPRTAAPGKGLPLAPFEREDLAATPRGAGALAAAPVDERDEAGTTVAIARGGLAPELRALVPVPAPSPPKGLARRLIGPVTAIAAIAGDRERPSLLACGVSRLPGTLLAPGPDAAGVWVFALRADGLEVVHREAATSAAGPFEVLALAAGDVLGEGRPSLAALVERADAAAPTRALQVYSGLGRPDAPVVRRDLVFGDRPVEWVVAADLDLDGDAELVAGGPAGARVYGLRAASRAPAPLPPAPGEGRGEGGQDGRSPSAGAPVAPPGAEDLLRAADDLLDLGLPDEALAAYREALDAAGAGPEERKRALHGVARAHFAARRFEEGLAAGRDLAARHPEEAREATLLAVERLIEAWRFADARALLDALRRRDDLSEAERARVRARQEAVTAHLGLEPALVARFERGIGDRPDPAPAVGSPGEATGVPGGLVPSVRAVWLLASAEGARWRPLGELELDLAAGQALLAPVPWRGGSFRVEAELKLEPGETGAAIRIGLAGRQAAAATAGTGGDAAGAGLGDGVALEVSTPLGVGLGMGRGLEGRLAVRAGERRVRAGISSASASASASTSESGTSVARALEPDVWYRVTLEHARAAGRVRLVVAERDGGRVVLAEEAALGGEAFRPEAAAAGLLRVDGGGPGAGRLRLAEVSVHLEPDERRATPPAPAEVAGSEARALLLRANAQVAGGETDRAVPLLSRAIEADPFLVEALLARARALAARGDVVAAAVDLARIAAEEPRARPDLRRLADALAAAGRGTDLLEVAEALRAATAVEDPEARALFARARDLVLADLAAEAEPAGGFGEAARVRRARLLLRTGEIGRAIDELDRALEVAPDSVDALLARGDAWLARADSRRAQSDFARAKQHSGRTDIRPYLGLAEALALKERWREAGLLLDLAAAVAPGRFDASLGAQLLRARVHLTLGDVEGAAKDYGRAAALDPRSRAAWAGLAAVAIRQDRPEDARRALERARRLGLSDER